MTSHQLLFRDSSSNAGQLQESFLSDRADLETGSPSSSRPSCFSASLARLSSTFPDVSTRVALSLVSLLTLLGFLFWLIFVIRERWVAATRTPASTLSVERQPFLPPLQSIIWEWNLPTEDPVGFYAASRFSALIPVLEVNATFSSKTSLSSSGDASTVLSSLQCVHVMLLAMTTVCVAPLEGAPASEGFHSAFDSLNMAVAFVFNRTEARLAKPADIDEPFLMPSLVGFSSDKMGSTDTARALIAVAPIDANTDPNDPRIATFNELVAPMPGTEFLNANAYSQYNLQFAKTIRLDDTVEWTMAVQSVSASIGLPTATHARAASQLRARFASDPVALARLERMLVDPDLELGWFEIGVAPGSFDVSVTTEYLSYGWASFLADLGGVLSIGLIVLRLLFPQRVPTTIPREFIGTKLVHCCCKKRA